jgi:transcriptional regulator with XRE-family HTH domain
MVTLQAHSHTYGMAQRVIPRQKLPRWRRLFLREWRVYRNMTQEQLAERVEMSVSNISQLERGLQGYSSEGLQRLAVALQCEPGHLLMVDPTRDNAIWSIWERASEAERQQIVAVSQAIVRKTGS